jgi:hypothetical protein
MTALREPFLEELFFFFRPSQMVSRHFLLSALLIVTASCRSVPSRTEPASGTPETTSPLPPSAELASRDSWVLQPTEHQHKYRASTISSVIMNQETASLRDSTALTIEFSVSIDRNSRGASYTATVDGLSLIPANRLSPSAVPDLPSPVSFTGRIGTGEISLITPADCNNQISSTLPVIQRSLILPPLQLRKEQTWTDSTSGPACSGSIPVTLTASRQYRVVGETISGARSSLLLERLDKTTSSGEGSEGQHRVQLKTEGTGKAQLLIDPVTGALIEATGTNTTFAVVTTSGRSQKFTQTSRDHISQR